MNKKIYGAFAIICSIVMFSSCGYNENTNEHSEHIVSQYTNLCHDGELFLDSYQRLNFCDFNSMKSTVICSNPNCKHKDKENCSSYDMENHPVLYNNNIFFFKDEIERKNNSFIYNTYLYKANKDGTNRIKVCSLCDLYIPVYSRIIAFDNYLYFVAEKVEFDKSGNSTGYSSAFLFKLNLNDGAFKKLTDIYCGYSGGSWVYGIYNNEIFITSKFFENNIDYFDSDNFNQSQNTSIAFNIFTEEQRNIENENIIFAENGHLILSENESDIIKLYDKNENETIIDDMKPRDLKIVNDKLISISDMMVYDLKSGKKQIRKEMDREIIDYINGKYILKKYTSDENYCEYSSESEELLFEDDLL